MVASCRVAEDGILSTNPFSEAQAIDDGPTMQSTRVVGDSSERHCDSGSVNWSSSNISSDAVGYLENLRQCGTAVCATQPLSAISLKCAIWSEDVLFEYQDAEAFEFIERLSGDVKSLVCNHTSPVTLVVLQALWRYVLSADADAEKKYKDQLSDPIDCFLGLPRGTFAYWEKVNPDGSHKQHSSSGCSSSRNKHNDSSYNRGNTRRNPCSNGGSFASTDRERIVERLGSGFRGFPLASTSDTTDGDSSVDVSSQPVDDVPVPLAFTSAGPLPPVTTVLVTPASRATETNGKTGEDAFRSQHSREFSNALVAKEDRTMSTEAAAVDFSGMQPDEEPWDSESFDTALLQRVAGVFNALLRNVASVIGSSLSASAREAWQRFSKHKPDRWTNGRPWRCCPIENDSSVSPMDLMEILRGIVLVKVAYRCWDILDAQAAACPITSASCDAYSKSRTSKGRPFIDLSLHPVVRCALYFTSLNYIDAGGAAAERYRHFPASSPSLFGGPLEPLKPIWQQPTSDIAAIQLECATASDKSFEDKHLASSSCPSARGDAPTSPPIYRYHAVSSPCVSYCCYQTTAMGTAEQMKWLEGSKIYRPKGSLATVATTVAASSRQCVHLCHSSNRTDCSLQSGEANCSQTSGFHGCSLKCDSYLSHSLADDRLPSQSENRESPDTQGCLEEEVQGLLRRTALSTEVKEKHDSVVRKIRGLLSQIFQNPAQLFGSYCNGFSAAASDCDLAVLLTTDELSKMRRAAVESGFKKPERQGCISLAQFLQRVGKSVFLCRAFSDIKAYAISSSSVPIVKVARTPVPNFSVDIVLNNVLGIRNSLLLKAYAERDSRVGSLGVLVKQWASSRDINSSYKGTISSYAWTLLVIYFCQVRTPPLLPNLQTKLPDSLSNMSYGSHVSKTTGTEKGDEWDPIVAWEESYVLLPGKHLCYFYDDSSSARPLLVSSEAQADGATVSSLLYQFFEFYSFGFNWMHDVVCIRLAPQLVSKKKLLLPPKEPCIKPTKKQSKPAPFPSRSVEEVKSEFMKFLDNPMYHDSSG